MNSFIFIGGDMRSIYAAQRLGKRYTPARLHTR